MRPPESHYRRSTGPAANGCGSFHAASTRRVAVWLLIALSGFWLPNALRTTYAKTADAGPRVILQQEGPLPATEVPGHTGPRLASCGYFLDHQHCPQTAVTVLSGRADPADMPPAATATWTPARFADVREAGHEQPPQFFPIPLYLRTSRLLI